VPPSASRLLRMSAKGSKQLFNNPRHGPLPALLLLLTVAAGVIDALSVLALGRVFIANMTGNVAFIGFALAGAPEFSLVASVLALAGFLIGAAMGGQIIARWRTARGRQLAVATTIEVVLPAATLAIAVVSGEPFNPATASLITALAAVGLGIQNAATRGLAVPDTPTTVLTTTLTGFAADLWKHNGQVLLRRLFAVVAMLVGALVGTLLLLHQGATWTLALALTLVTVACGGAWLFARRPGAWQAPAH
jgi:uncharacterized membrane protein YoaK (UPF0700 family)